MRVFAFVFAVAAIAAAFPVCAKDQSKAQNQNGLYAVLLKSSSNPYWAAMAQGFQDASDQIGIPYEMKMSDGDHASSMQLAACMELLEKKPDVLFVAAIDMVALLPCLSQASSQNIHIVDLDQNIDPAVAALSGVKLAFRIGSDHVRAGEQAAEFIAQQLGVETKGEIGIIEGDNNIVSNKQRAEGFRSRLKKIAPDLKIAASIYSNGERQSAGAATKEILTKYPKVLAIFAVNDTMALGVSDAAIAKDKKPVIVGIDGTKEALRAVKSGQLTASVAQLPYLIARQSVEGVQDMDHGMKTQAIIYTPTFVISNEVLNKRDNHMLRYVK